MESQTVTILFVGDEKCGKTSFLSCVHLLLNHTITN
jgi:GTPase SAR1 family protein